MDRSGFANVFAVVCVIVGLGSTPTSAQSPRPVQPPAAEPRVGQLVRTETLNLDNWQVTCQEFVNPTRRNCSAILQLLQANQQTNTATVVVQWVIQLADGVMNATVQTPTGVLIGPGIELKAGRAQRKFAYNRCDQQRCDFNFTIDDALSRDLAAADTAEFLLRNGQNAPVALNVPMKGYERAIQALRR
jgi:invasion protein IalB